MNKIIVLSVIVFLCMDLVCLISVEETFTNTWDSIRSAWNDMIVAIKKPVRPRRLGSIGRRRTAKITTTTYQTLETTTDPITTSTRNIFLGKVILFPEKELSAPDKAVSAEMPPVLKKITFPEGFAETTTAPGEKKVRVPYLTHPPWRTIEEWQKMQRPHFVKVIREGKVNGDFPALIAATDRLTDEERFGVLIFV